MLHIYGISKAGYIPQLFSLRLPNPDVIYELLQEANAKALIYDPIYESSLKDFPLPTFLAAFLEDAGSHKPLPGTLPVNEDDIAFIFHTSGSTSGSPKLVPCSYRWLESVILKSNQVSRPQSTERQDVTVWM